MHVSASAKSSLRAHSTRARGASSAVPTVDYIHIAVCIAYIKVSARMKIWVYINIYVLEYMFGYMLACIYQSH